MFSWEQNNLILRQFKHVKTGVGCRTQKHEIMNHKLNKGEKNENRK